MSQKVISASLGLFCLMAVSQALLIPDRVRNDLAKSSKPAADGMMEEAWADEWTYYLDRYAPRKLGHFQWKTCGGASDAFQITNLTLSPDPIQLGHPLKITASGQITSDLASPIEVVVTVQKKVFVWVTLPCVDGLGSCTYADLCSQLPPPPCPPPLIQANLPCTCPFPAGTYTVNDLEVEFDSSKYPAWLTEGDFKAHIEVKKTDQSIACYDVELNITS